MPHNQVLRQVRALRGWSQMVLARQLDTSTKNVSRWERGETVPSPYYRERLCQLFGLDARSLGLLASEEGDMFSATEAHSESKKPLFDPAVPPLLFDMELFVGREQLLQNLLPQVQPGNRVTLCGLPGVGKTSLLQVLVRTPQIQERFSDGVLWVGLGPTPDIARHMLRLAHLLNIPPAAFECEHTEEEWSQLLCDALAERHLLIVIDDVWKIEATLPFLVGCPFVAYAITTRLPKVALSLAQEHLCMVPPLSLEASIHLLTQLVAQLKQVDDVLLQKVVQLTGNLPLALMLIGRYLALHSYGGQMRRLEMALNQLTDLGYRLNLSTNIPPINYMSKQSSSSISSLAAVIAISDQQLPSSARSALRALSVLPTAPASFSEEAALAVTAVDVEVLDLLVDMGLIQPAENHCYQIHRAVSDYASYHRKDKIPQMRLVRYACQVAVNHATNVNLLQREYATLLAGFDTAVALQMRNETIQTVLALAPFMRIHRFYTQADQSLRKALQAAIFEQDLLMCQKLLDELVECARLRRDATQIAAYVRIQQRLTEQLLGQESIHKPLQQLRTTLKGDIETPRLYVI
jgi:transcriptional regulator with XRE-family HTH domain